jgi:hypothetical protein
VWSGASHTKIATEVPNVTHMRMMVFVVSVCAPPTTNAHQLPHPQKLTPSTFV